MKCQICNQEKDSVKEHDVLKKVDISRGHERTLSSKLLVCDDRECQDKLKSYDKGLRPGKSEL
jgi:hypothetical protein